MVFTNLSEGNGYVNASGFRRLYVIRKSLCLFTSLQKTQNPLRITTLTEKSISKPLACSIQHIATKESAKNYLMMPLNTSDNSTTE